MSDFLLFDPDVPAVLDALERSGADAVLALVFRAPPPPQLLSTRVAVATVDPGRTDPAEIAAQIVTIANAANGKPPGDPAMSAGELTLAAIATVATLVTAGACSRHELPTLQPIAMPGTGLETMWWEAITVVDTTAPTPPTTTPPPPSAAADSTVHHHRNVHHHRITFDPARHVPDPGRRPVPLSVSRDRRNDAQQRLQEVVVNKDLREAEAIVIVGHTDSLGDEAYNDQLGLDRANATRDALILLGVDPAIISAESRGEREPVANESSADSETARALNRRVELAVLDATAG